MASSTSGEMISSISLYSVESPVVACCSTNDVNYGRKTDYGSERLNAATFHGRDFAGVLKKAKEGHFTSLGVDVVWLTDVYEQIHGWMTGSGTVNDLFHTSPQAWMNCRRCGGLQVMEERRLLVVARTIGHRRWCSRSWDILHLWERGL